MEAIADWTAAHEDTIIGQIARNNHGKPVGMGWPAIIHRVPIPARRSGDIQSVYVAPQRRGTGLGHRLIDALVDKGRAHGLDRIVLHSKTSGTDFYRHIV